MDSPTVCAVLLTADRPDMTHRAVKCFQNQNHRGNMLILDTGETPFVMTQHFAGDACWHRPELRGATVGELRNAILTNCDADIILHWDSDDWSHPNRIAEQVAFLQASGAECVGYNQMLFWDSRACYTHEPDGAYKPIPGTNPAAWLYTGAPPALPLGTSLCYWRSAWERHKFPATSQGEDTRWLAGVNWLATKAFALPYSGDEMIIGGNRWSAPRMIASIHGGNTSNAYRPELMQRCAEWRRVPEWDAHCAGVMAL